MKKFGVLALVLAIAVAAAFAFRSGGSGAKPIVVTLVPGPPQPRVSPEEAGIDPAAIQAAVDFAGKHGSSALIIGRGGHLVFEKYWGDTTLDSVLPPGDFASVLVPLLVGSAMNDRLIASLDEPVSNYLPEYTGTSTGAATLRNHLGASVVESAVPSPEVLAHVLEKITRKPYETLVSERLWQPLGGGEFSITRDGVGARLGDWMRVGELLANDGVFEGNQVTPPRYVALMMRPTHENSPVGFGVNVAGSFAADVAWLRASPGHRLWIVPSLRLVILRVSGDSEDSKDWDEAMIPDSIIRGVHGWVPRSVREGVDPKKYAPH